MQNFGKAYGDNPFLHNLPKSTPGDPSDLLTNPDIKIKFKKIEEGIRPLPAIIAIEMKASIVMLHNNELESIIKVDMNSNNIIDVVFAKIAELYKKKATKPTIIKYKTHTHYIKSNDTQPQYSLSKHQFVLDASTIEEVLPKAQYTFILSDETTDPAKPERYKITISKTKMNAELLPDTVPPTKMDLVFVLCLVLPIPIGEYTEEVVSRGGKRRRITTYKQRKSINSLL